MYDNHVYTWRRAQILRGFRFLRQNGSPARLIRKRKFDALWVRQNRGATYAEYVRSVTPHLRNR